MDCRRCSHSCVCKFYYEARTNLMDLFIDKREVDNRLYNEIMELTGSNCMHYKEHNATE